VTGIGARRLYKVVPATREAVRLLAAAGLAAALGACSWTFPMTSLVDEPETTASTAPRFVSPLSPDLGEEDWRRAKAALAVALDPQGSGAQVSWDNPDSRLKGAFTPVGRPFVKSDEICRAFLASLTGPDAASSLQGTACRPSGGEWEIKDVTPFRKA
jgi:17 kDa outer membrane surface antigen